MLITRLNSHSVSIYPSMSPKLTEEEISEMLSLFAEWDKNVDGFLTMAEIK